MTKTFIKDPDEVLDYQLDFTNLLALEETISQVTITITPTGEILLDSELHTDNIVTVWLSGGTIGYAYLIDCKVVTSSDRKIDRDIMILVQNK